MMKTILAVSSLAVIYGNVALAGDEAPDAAALERGGDVYGVCETCHGEQGEGSEDLAAPKLAGQYDWYLAAQLRNFRANLRGIHEADENGQIMQAMAADLEDEEIEDVVSYIMTLDADYVPEED